MLYLFLKAKNHIDFLATKILKSSKKSIICCHTVFLNYIFIN